MYEDSQDPPSAKIEYLVNEMRAEHDWQLDTPTLPELNHISIFDSSCATIHVDKPNDVAYTPMTLDILAKLAQASRDIKNKLESEVAVHRKCTPEFITNNKSRDYTATGAFLRNLSHHTNLSDVDSLTDISEAENCRYREILNLLHNDPLVQIEKSTIITNKINEIVQYVESSYGQFKQDSILALKSLYEDVAKKEKISSVAAEALFKGEPLSGIGSEVWRELWESARKYSNIVYKDLGFPYTGKDSRCVLCQQELSAESSVRLIKFEDFVKKDAQRQAVLSKQNLAQELVNIKQYAITRKKIHDYYKFIKVDLKNTELAKITRKYLIRVFVILRNINKANTSEDINEYRLDFSFIKDFNDILDDIKIHIDTLKSSLDPEGRKTLEIELAAIEDRIWLGEHKIPLLEEIKKLKLINNYNLSINETDTRNITIKSTEIANVLITNTLRDRFTQELNELGINHLRAELVQQRSNYGIPKFKVQLVRNPSAPIRKVLSEGEYRSIAIAAFLAELSTADHKSGMVFDDPVCSLDHDYRHRIAKRLVKEATQRQVIIFTHDISFVFMLQTSTKKDNVSISYQAVENSSTHSGICQSNPPFNILPVCDALHQLEVYLNQVKVLYENGSLDEWGYNLDSLAIRIRKCWELAIEKLLSPVFTRFSYKVDTRGLLKMSVFTDDDSKVMRESYGKISQWEHSEASTIGSPLPSPSDVQQEITVLRSWYNDIETRQRTKKQ